MIILLRKRHSRKQQSINVKSQAWSVPSHRWILFLGARRIRLLNIIFKYLISVNNVKVNGYEENIIIFIENHFIVLRNRGKTSKTEDLGKTFSPCPSPSLAPLSPSFASPTSAHRGKETIRQNKGCAARRPAMPQKVVPVTMATGTLLPSLGVPLCPVHHAAIRASDAPSDAPTFAAKAVYTVFVFLSYSPSLDWQGTDLIRMLFFRSATQNI